MLSERKNKLSGKGRRIEQMVGLGWLMFAYLGYRIDANSVAGYHLGMATSGFNFGFFFLAGPFRNTAINSLEKYFLVPVSLVLSLSLFFSLF